MMALTFDAPQGATTEFLIQVKRLIQKDGSAFTAAKSEYWVERLVSSHHWMTTRSSKSVDLYILMWTQTFYAPQVATIAFLIQVKRLIQKDGSAVTAAKSEYWGERLVSSHRWMAPRGRESVDICTDKDPNF
jgi:hypothetical protein